MGRGKGEGRKGGERREGEKRTKKRDFVPLFFGGLFWCFRVGGSFRYLSVFFFTCASVGIVMLFERKKRGKEIGELLMGWG